MLYNNVRLVGTHLLVIDAAGFSLFVGAALWITEPEAWASWSATGTSLAIYSLTAALLFLVFGSRLHAYHARRTDGLTRELVSLAEVSLYALAFLLLLAHMSGVGFRPESALRTALTCIVAMLTLRLGMRLLIRYLRSKGRDEKVWLVVGSGRRARDLVRTISANRHFGVRIHEVVDLEPKNGASASPPEPGTEGEEVRYLRTVDEIRDILKQNVIDEVVITLPIRSYYDEIQELIAIGREAGISIMLPPDPFSRPDYRTELTMTGNIPMVTHFTGPSNYVQLGIKRLTDIVVSAVGLVLLLPLFAVIAVWIKLDSPGPVFFLSPRIGLHGRKFQMVKFRSMVADAPALQAQLTALNETDGVAFKIRNDPRITRAGRVLRSYHLDELPQLWNVLVGDMSLVGPRPLPPNEATGREWWHLRRLSMPPGMTCFWQITGNHTMPFQEWATLDLRYIDGWSVWLDLKLIATTLVVLLRRPGW